MSRQELVTWAVALYHDKGICGKHDDTMCKTCLFYTDTILDPECSLNCIPLYEDRCLVRFNMAKLVIQENHADCFEELL